MDFIGYIRKDFRRRFDRPKLPKEKLDFLQSLIPFGLVVQEQTTLKAEAEGILSPFGIYASVALADMIVRSNWGTVPAAVEASNLFSFKNDSLPEIRTKTKKLGEDKVKYRNFDTWYEFVNYLTNHYVYSGLYESLLKERSPDRQADLLAEFYSLQNIDTYGNILEEIIVDFGLVEFDNIYNLI